MSFARHIVSAWLLFAIPPVVTAVEPLPASRFTLKNGLTVVVSEDHTTPLVAVVVVYHVGSRYERPGQKGFAHLYEHLMFNGTENFKGEYFEPMRKIGASNVGGTTSRDFTIYHQVVPVSGLETALWMESDRMGYLLGAVDQGKLDEQRRVVKNEMQLADDAPFGRTQVRALAGLLPPEHPYSWRSLGLIGDLEAAGLNDVKQWFVDYYGAANAFLFLVGDVSEAQARELAEKYFGGVRSGNAVPRQTRWIARRSGPMLDTMSDRVPYTGLERWWAVPPWGEKDSALLWLVGELLAGDRSARLRTLLVDDLKLASNVEASLNGRELMSEFRLNVALNAGTDPAAVSQALDRALADLAARGATSAEISRAATRMQRRVYNQREDLLERSFELAQGTVFSGDPGAQAQRMNWVTRARPEDVKRVAGLWLNQDYYQLTTFPAPGREAAATDVVDRSRLPDAPGLPDPAFPEVDKFELSNGVRVEFVPRHSVPLVRIAVQFETGAAMDALAGFTLDMLDEGAGGKSAAEIAERIAAMGGELKADVQEDAAALQLATLGSNLDQAVTLLAQMVTQPAFEQEAVERVRGLRRARLDAAKSDQIDGLRYYLPALLFPAGHPYAGYFLGLGTAEQLAAVSRDQLVAYHRTHMIPANTRLVVVGDADPAELRRILNQRFGSWRGTGDVAARAPIPAPAVPPAKGRGRVVLVNRPGAGQSILIAGHALTAAQAENEAALHVFNDAIGGNFISRLNLNLRENKGWSYGSLSIVNRARNGSFWVAFAFVQGDKTVDSLREMQREFEDARSVRPLTQSELDVSAQGWGSGALARLQKNEGVLEDLLLKARLALPPDHDRRFLAALKSLRLDVLQSEVEAMMAPEQMVWVVIGDAAAQAEEIRALNLGEVTVFNDLDQAIGSALSDR